MLIWSFLGISTYYYLTINKKRDPIPQKIHLNFGKILAIGLFLPIGGVLADAYFGRYKVILHGMWFMWLGAMLNGLSLILGKFVGSYEEHGDPWISVFSKAVMGAGFGAFQANIIQFGIDQLSDASSTEIISFIMWYTLMLFACGITIEFSGYCTPEYILVLVVTLYLTLALCSNFLLNHWLVKDRVITNPLPQIWKIVQYTMKNRQQWQRIFTLEEHGVLSKFNIAKTMYAGPFTSEQVEDVKTFLRVVGVIAIFMIACSGIPTTIDMINRLEPHLHDWPNNTSLKACYKELGVTYVQYIFLLVVVLMYQIIIHPLLRNCNPIKVSITTKFFISVFLFFASVMALLGIESASYHHQFETTTKCVFQNEHNDHVDIELYWTIIPRVFITLSLFTFLLSGIEFICAQVPFNMKGLVLGIAYAMYGWSLSLIHI